MLTFRVGLNFICKIGVLFFALLSFQDLHASDFGSNIQSRITLVEPQDPDTTAAQLALRLAHTGRSVLVVPAEALNEYGNVRAGTPAVLLTQTPATTAVVKRGGGTRKTLYVGAFYEIGGYVGQALKAPDELSEVDGFWTQTIGGEVFSGSMKEYETTYPQKDWFRIQAGYIKSIGAANSKTGFHISGAYPAWVLNPFYEVIKDNRVRIVGYGLRLPLPIGNFISFIRRTDREFGYGLRHFAVIDAGPEHLKDLVQPENSKVGFRFSAKMTLGFGMSKVDKR